MESNKYKLSEEQLQSIHEVIDSFITRLKNVYTDTHTFSLEHRMQGFRVKLNIERYPNELENNK